MEKGVTFFCQPENPEKIIPEYWEYDKKNLQLVLRIHPYYDVDLERCTTGAQVMDWIFQLRWKSWCTPDVMMSFLDTFEKAFSDIFHSTAQAMCSMGNTYEADWNKGKIVEVTPCKRIK